ncbi:MAG: TonB-dependent receptor, partial [Chryseobacterium sp.]
TQLNGGIVSNIIPKGGIIDLTNTSVRGNNLRGQINIDKEWQRHNLAVMVGEEIRSVGTLSRLERTYGFNSETLSTSAVDYRSPYPNYVTKSNSVIPFVNSFISTQYNFLSFFSNGAYTFDGKYTFSASVRRDASNLFGLETNDKWTPLWSAGLSWNIARETFFITNFMDELKLRATYGFSGNVDPSKSASTTLSYLGNSIFTNSPTAQVANFANPDLRWEKVRTVNLGLNFSFFKRRVWGSVDVFEKNATDLYAVVPIDYSAGLNISTITKNVAAMRARGVDLELNTNNFVGRFSWISTLNLNFYKDKVTNYYLTRGSASRFVSNNRVPVEGYPVWSSFGYKWAGLDANGNPQGYLNGAISQNYSSINGTGSQISDLSYLGPRMPNTFGSLGNTFSYQNLSLSIRMTYGFGHYIRRQSINYSTLMTLGYGSADYANRWKSQGDENITNVPSVIYPLVAARDDFYNGSDIHLLKADFLRIQYITLNYQIPSRYFRSFGLKNVNIYANLNNVGVIWRANKFGIDPEAVFTNQQMPNPVTVSGGLKIGF